MNAGRVDVQISIAQSRLRSKMQITILKCNKIISYLNYHINFFNYL